MATLNYRETDKIHIIFSIQLIILLSQNAVISRWNKQNFNGHYYYYYFSSTSLLLPTHLAPPSCTHAQSCNPTDCSPPGSSVHGLFQARKLEWVATSFYNIMYFSCFAIKCIFLHLQNISIHMLISNK